MNCDDIRQSIIYVPFAAPSSSPPKLSDEILLTLGANAFLGAHDATFFGKFEHNTNVYARVRYRF